MSRSDFAVVLTKEEAWAFFQAEQEQLRECQLMTVGQVARYLGCTPATIHNLAKSGALKYHKVGTHRRFLRDDVLEYIDSTSNQKPKKESAPRASIREAQNTSIQK